MYCYGKSRCYPFISIVTFCAYEDEYHLVRSMIEHCYQLSDVIMIVGLGGNTHRCDTTTMDVYILYNASLGTVQLQFVI